MKQFLWFSLILLVGCGIDQPKEEVNINEIESDFIRELRNEEVLDDIDTNAHFLNFYRNFLTALMGDSNDELDRCFHPKYGVHIIHSISGAIPEVSQFKKSSYFYHDENIRIAIESLSEDIILEPLFEELPRVVCDEKNYDKTGCYAEYTSNKLVQHPWNVDSEYSDLIKTVKVTVVNTYLCVFYFSIINGEWYVTFIDLRVPCQG